MKDITAKMVMRLRQKTGIGIMKCKKILNISKSFEDALKKIDEEDLDTKRNKNEGMLNGAIGVFVRQKAYVMVELNCETDFVSQNKHFKDLLREVANNIGFANIKYNKEINGCAFLKTCNTLKKLINNAIQLIGEHIEIKRFVKMSSENDVLIAHYIHSNNKIGVALSFKVSNKDQASNSLILSVMKDISMHIAASSPLYIDKKNILEMKNMTKFFEDQALKKSDSRKIREFIIKSKIKKYISQVCLMEQCFIKDINITVKKLLLECELKTKTKIDILNFYRFEISKL